MIKWGSSSSMIVGSINESIQPNCPTARQAEWEKRVKPEISILFMKLMLCFLLHQICNENIINVKHFSKRLLTANKQQQKFILTFIFHSNSNETDGLGLKRQWYFYYLICPFPSCLFTSFYFSICIKIVSPTRT